LTDIQENCGAVFAVVEGHEDGVSYAVTLLDGGKCNIGWYYLCSIGSIKRTIFRKLRTETILKIYNTLVLPTSLYGSENWTLTALQRRRIEAAEMKLLRPLAGYTLHDHKTNDSIRRELQTDAY
jgi:hypothetical protein